MTDLHMIVSCWFEIWIRPDTAEDPIEALRQMTSDLQALCVDLFVDWLIYTSQEDVAL